MKGRYPPSIQMFSIKPQDFIYYVPKKFGQARRFELPLMLEVPDDGVYLDFFNSIIGNLKIRS